MEGVQLKQRCWSEVLEDFNLSHVKGPCSSLYTQPSAGWLRQRVLGKYL